MARPVGVSISYQLLYRWLTAAPSARCCPHRLTITCRWDGTQVTQTLSWCFACLRQLRQSRRSVPTVRFQMLVVALVRSWLDYCNALLADLPAWAGLPEASSSVDAQCGWHSWVIAWDSATTSLTQLLFQQRLYQCQFVCVCVRHKIERKKTLIKKLCNLARICVTINSRSD